MGEKIKADYKDATKVEVLNMTYLLATPGQGRNQLMQDVAEDPKFTLTDKEVPIPGAVQGGRDFTAAWLSAHPPTDGVELMIYAVFDQPAEGAVAALKQAGRDDVRIYSYDATPAGLALVKEGYIVADIQNGRAAQATQAIEAAQRVVSGDLTMDAPELVPAAYFIVTTENVAKYEEDFPAAFTEEGV
jgi:ribose transport system substrate-binding protein